MKIYYGDYKEGHIIGLNKADFIDGTRDFVRSMRKVGVAVQVECVTANGKDPAYKVTLNDMATGSPAMLSLGNRLSDLSSQHASLRDAMHWLRVETRGRIIYFDSRRDNARAVHVPEGEED